MLNFEHWKLATDTRDAILNLANPVGIIQEIDSALNKLNSSDNTDFLQYLSSLFLTIVVNKEGALPNDIPNITKALENAQEARSIIKDKLLYKRQAS